VDAKTREKLREYYAQERLGHIPYNPNIGKWAWLGVVASGLATMMCIAWGACHL